MRRILAILHPLSFVENVIHQLELTTAQFTVRPSAEGNHGYP
jgi:hypothetical protein